MKEDRARNYLITGKWEFPVYGDCLVTCKPKALASTIMSYIEIGLDPNTMRVYEIKRHVNFTLVEEVVAIRTDG